MSPYLQVKKSLTQKRFKLISNVNTSSKFCNFEEVIFNQYEKAFFTFYFLLFTDLSAQETFFRFTTGWSSRNIVENENKYVVFNTSTFTNSNHIPVTEFLSINGDSISSFYFQIDTISLNYSYKNSFTETNSSNYVAEYCLEENTQLFKGLLVKYNDNYSDTISTKIIEIGNNGTILKLCTAKNDTTLILGSYNKNGDNLYTTFLETDTSGNIRWQQDFDCTGDCNMGPFHILPTEDNGFLFTCFEDHLGQGTILNTKTAVIKTDSLGNTEWRHTWGGDTTRNFGSWVVPLDDGNFLYAWTDCFTTENPEQHNTEGTIRFIKFDIDGNVIWHKHMLDHISHGHSYRISQMELMPDGNIIVGGYKGTAGILLKVDQEAEYLWHRELFPPGLTMDENNNVYQYMKILGITCTSDDGFILAGEYFSAPGGVFTDVYQSAYAYKLDEYGCYEPNCDVGIEEILVEEEKSFILKPNPACDFVLVEGLKLKVKSIEIYDLTGKLVYSSSLWQAQHIAPLSVTEGLYPKLISPI